MNKEQIQNIIGKDKKRKLKNYIKTKGGEIIETKLLEYDNFMECYGIVRKTLPNGYQVFDVVSIEQEADTIEELEYAITID